MTLLNGLAVTVDGRNSRLNVLNILLWGVFMSCYDEGFIFYPNALPSSDGLFHIPLADSA